MKHTLLVPGERQSFHCPTPSHTLLQPHFSASSEGTQEQGTDGPIQGNPSAQVQHSSYSQEQGGGVKAFLMLNTLTVFGPSRTSDALV